MKQKPNSKNGTKGKKQSKKKEGFKCFNCQKTWHFAKDCRQGKMQRQVNAIQEGPKKPQKEVNVIEKFPKKVKIPELRKQISKLQELRNNLQEARERVLSRQLWTKSQEQKAKRLETHDQFCKQEIETLTQAIEEQTKRNKKYNILT